METKNLVFCLCTILLYVHKYIIQYIEIIPFSVNCNEDPWAKNIITLET